MLLVFSGWRLAILLTNKSGILTFRGLVLKSLHYQASCKLPKASCLLDKQFESDSQNLSRKFVI